MHSPQLEKTHKYGKLMKKYKTISQTLTILASTAIFLSSPNAQDHQTIYEMQNGKKVIITETHPVGQSLSNIDIMSQNFEYNLNETVENSDPVKKVIIADIDDNGFDEIYIFTTSAGSGSYGNILAFSSNKDKSLSMINCPEIQKDDKYSDGYMGHDFFTIINQRLIRYFPIYLEGDSHKNPTGGKREIIYKLFPGEATWQLKIEKVEDIK